MNSSDNEIIKKNTDFGSVLAVARKSKSYSIEDVCEQLKIPAQTIAAIETNDVAALPAPTFTQGYIRAYAKFLEISEENVLNIYNQAVPHEQSAKLKPRSNLPSEVSSQSLAMKAVTLLLIVAGISAIIYGSFQYYQKKVDVIETELESKEPRFTGNSLDSPGTNQLTIKQNARLTEDDELIVEPPVSLVEEIITQPRPEIANTSSVPETDELSASVEVNNVETTVKVVNDTLDPASGEDLGKITAVDVLKIYAIQGSWVQVRDARKKRLFYNMIPKGGGKVLQGQAPFRISLGNAKTTKLVINDLVIDMSEYIRENNTASFIVSTKQQNVIFH